MLSWPHSGFHVHQGVRIEADDALGLLQVARDSARAPIAPERRSDDTSKEQVTIRSGKSIVAFILDPEAIGAILRHLRRAGRDPRALLEHAPRVPP